MTYETSGMMKGVRLLCALALLFVGFAHNAPAIGGQPLPSAQLSQYVFPDGSAHSLCLPAGDDDGAHGTSGFRSGCEACRLSASILPPSPVDVAGWLIRLPADSFIPCDYDAPRQPLVTAHAAPRGPPSGSKSAAAAASAAAISAYAG